MSLHVLSICQTPEKNQGYFVFIHSDGSSSDEGKIGGSKSPTSPSSLASTPQADLEWDEEIVSVAPSTKEDEKWTTMYKWYAAILECTGAAIAAASGVSNGIDQQDAFMRTALHYAVEKGNSGIVRLILDAGCKVDVTAGDGLTSLHIAVMRNHVEIVKQLLAAGSHVNYKTHEKNTALHFAASRGFLEMVESPLTSTTDLASTVFELLYDENESVTDSDLVTETLFTMSSPEFDNVTEMTFFDKIPSTIRPIVTPKKKSTNECYCNLLVSC
ncbi:jg9411 [Pararge aegeria aegeria]|uniref:Jg9411 protein n=1 Tax=Pararge aegeria aegeria TaxID=348720 RepID=A0A8S4RXB6_9NEOP|nr:jg9411 [Pararge aegeria aegeria]